MQYLNKVNNDGVWVKVIINIGDKLWTSWILDIYIVPVVYIELHVHVHLYTLACVHFVYTACLRYVRPQKGCFQLNPPYQVLKKNWEMTKMWCEICIWDGKNCLAKFLYFYFLYFFFIYGLISAIRSRYPQQNYF